MTVLTESHISPRTVAEKPRARPVRMVRWFIIVGLLLTLLVGALVGFNKLRTDGIADYFAKMKPPAASVTSGRSARPPAWRWARSTRPIRP